MAQEKLPHRKELCLQSEALYSAFHQQEINTATESYRFRWHSFLVSAGYLPDTIYSASQGTLGTILIHYSPCNILYSTAKKGN